MKPLVMLLHKPHPRVGLALAALATTAMACSDVHDGRTHWPDAQVWRSEHFAYHARPDDDSVGEEVLDSLEANAAFIADDQLGVNLGDLGSFHYFRYRDAAELKRDGRCQVDSAVACTLVYPDAHIEVHSPLAVDVHELTHAYAERLGSPAPWLAEGLAVALSCDPELSATFDQHDSYVELDLLSDWQAALLAGQYDTEPNNGQVVRAGLFVSWLVDQHGGLEKLVELYRGLGVRDDAATTEALFEGVYGLPLPEAWHGLTQARTRRACLSSASCAAMKGLLPPGAAGNAVSALPGSGMLVGGASPVEPPVIHACSAAAATVDIAWPSIDGATFADSAALFPNRDDYVLEPGPRAEQPWNHGPEWPASLALTTLDALSSDCSTAPRIQLDRVALQFWPRATEQVVHVSKMTDIAVLVEAAVQGDAPLSSFEVRVCSRCEAGVLEECESITEHYGTVLAPTPAPWIAVAWNPLENGILTIHVL